MKPTKIEQKIINAYHKWKSLASTSWALELPIGQIRDTLKNYGIKLNNSRNYFKRHL